MWSLCKVVSAENSFITFCIFVPSVGDYWMSANNPLCSQKLQNYGLQTLSGYKTGPLSNVSIHSFKNGIVFGPLWKSIWKPDRLDNLDAYFVAQAESFTSGWQRTVSYKTHFPDIFWISKQISPKCLEGGEIPRIQRQILLGIISKIYQMNTLLVWKLILP